MMVTITSLVPRKARKNPGIAPAIPPASMAMMTVARIKSGLGMSGFARANQPANTHPTRAWPDRPTLKKPARLATAKPRAVKTRGATARKISPIFLTEPKAV